MLSHEPNGELSINSVKILRQVEAELIITYESNIFHHLFSHV